MMVQNFMDVYFWVNMWSIFQKQLPVHHFMELVTCCYRTDGVGGCGERYTITERTLPFSLGVLLPHLLGSPCPPLEERRFSMPEIGVKERNYLLKSYTDLE